MGAGIRECCTCLRHNLKRAGRVPVRQREEGWSALVAACLVAVCRAWNVQCPGSSMVVQQFVQQSTRSGCERCGVHTLPRQPRHAAWCRAVRPLLSTSASMSSASPRPEVDAILLLMRLINAERATGSSPWAARRNDVARAGALERPVAMAGALVRLVAAVKICILLPHGHPTR